MSCEPKFVAGFDFSCVKDVIADVRGGVVSVATIQKALWIAGSGIAFFEPVNAIASTLAGEVSDMSVAELCDALEANEAHTHDVAALNPAIVLMLIELALKLLKNWKK